MEKARKDVLDFVSETYDTEFESKKIGDIVWDAMHYYNVKVSNDYNHYSVKDFITLYHIDCLLEKGEITENDRNCLIRLFYQRKDLYGRIGRDKKEDSNLCAKIDLIDEIFERYNIGSFDLSTMIYNNAILKEKIDLNSELAKRKL